MAQAPQRNRPRIYAPASTPAHFLLRVGDGIHFNRSSSQSIWGITSTSPVGKGFKSTVKAGDILWFVTGRSKGKIIAMATFTQTRERIIGPIIDLTATNEELGWTNTEGNWDTEVHYKDLFNLTERDLLTGIKGAATVRLYKEEKCNVNLPAEYQSILRYSKITKSM
jgi:hypothetical protein